MKAGAVSVLNSSRVTERWLEKSTQQKEEKQGQKKETKSVYAGDLNTNQDLIGNRKALGHKQAIKKILDSFTKELNLDDSVSKLRNQQEEFLENIKEYTDKLKSVQDMKADIQKAYNVPEDSKEQKDTELLIKAKNNSGDLTKEERERLNSIGPLTDYQKEILEVNKMETDWNRRIQSASMGIAGINHTIQGISLERLKTRPILDARKEAESILEDTSKTVTNLLLEEAVENTDKKLEDNNKNSETVKEDTQPKTKEEEKTEPEDNSIEDLSSKHEKLLREIKKQAQKDNLSAEDIKGLLVDAQS